jgi:hypothetical protein
MPAEQPTAKPIAPAATFEASSGTNPFPRFGWLGDAIRQLDAIENLPDGWDLHNSARPDSIVVRKGEALLALLLEADKSLQKPRIDPTPSGGVQFSWECGQRYLEIEILDRDRAQFYFIDGDAHSDATAEFPSATLPQSVVGYARLFSRHDA